MINDSLNSKETILQYIDNEAVNKFVPKENEDYVKKRIKLGIKKEMLSPDSDYAKEHARQINNELTEVRIAKEIRNFGTVMQIYDNKISYLTLSENKKIGIIIEDQDIANMHKIFFRQAWENGERVTTKKENLS